MKKYMIFMLMSGLALVSQAAQCGNCYIQNLTWYNFKFVITVTKKVEPPYTPFEKPFIISVRGYSNEWKKQETGNAKILNVTVCSPGSEFVRATKDYPVPQDNVYLTLKRNYDERNDYEQYILESVSPNHQKLISATTPDGLKRIVEDEKAAGGDVLKLLTETWYFFPGKGYLVNILHLSNSAEFIKTLIELVKEASPPETANQKALDFLNSGDTFLKLTALHYAKTPEIIETLVKLVREAGPQDTANQRALAYLNSKDSRDMTALYEQIDSVNNIETLVRLVREAGTPETANQRVLDFLNSKSHRGTTVLRLAIREDERETARTLVRLAREAGETRSNLRRRILWIRDKLGKVKRNVRDTIRFLLSYITGGTLGP